ncbi:MAG: response regulator [Terriglobia bacterium]|jgi:CheY-like chemotaxis protein
MKSILIADDDRVQTLMLSTRLKAKGFKVTVASDAIQAWMSAIKTLPDVIVLDIQMPGGTVGGASMKGAAKHHRESKISSVTAAGAEQNRCGCGTAPF